MSLLFSSFYFLGKTEEVFGMHEWAAKQKEKKNENQENSSGKFSLGCVVER